MGSTRLDSQVRLSNVGQILEQKFDIQRRLQHSEPSLLAWAELWNFLFWIGLQGPKAILLAHLDCTGTPMRTQMSTLKLAWGGSDL
jgi:hypothetical protein